MGFDVDEIQCVPRLARLHIDKAKIGFNSLLRILKFFTTTLFVLDNSGIVLLGSIVAVILLSPCIFRRVDI